MKGLKEAKEKILDASIIAISGHINPDGDSIGSILSLGLGLKKLGKRLYIISQDGVPRRYMNLPGAEYIIKTTPVKPDLAISVDCGTKEMLGKTFETFEKARCILEIDHHEFRRPFGHVSLVDNNAAAVGEIIYALLKALEVDITREIAQNILTSIIVETNSFRLPNVRPITFDICAELVRLKIDFYKLVETVFWSRTKESTLLLGICLSRCEFLKGKKIVWSIVRREDFERIGGKDEDVDPVADELRSIKDVKIAVLFRERENGLLRVSLRSKKKINIASIAEKYNGGGHFDAAGCYIPNTTISIKGFLRSVEGLIS